MCEPTSDEAVARSELPRGGGEVEHGGPASRRGHGRRSASGADQGLVSEIVVVGDERVPQPALAGAAHDGPEVERTHLVEGGRGRDRRCFGNRPEDDGPGPVLLFPQRRQGDRAVLVHGRHGDPGHHVLEPAVGLEPADAPAERLRQGMAVQRRLAVEPAMPGAVLVEHHADAGLARPATPMGAPRLGALRTRPARCRTVLVHVSLKTKP